ncbi:holo-[acyl-carrier protein] synthase [Azonexus fungiphilus]|uniref:Holo-[acyl-carrier-protein] synthase n=1 Tax=Azonexus fungiphilus TaxID=146940 RepID=A0A495WHF0_9RHOO|nr:holo-ACP synthase [Azonexus fungiphilus]NHC07616.1 holo-ACP synthase [Azonexus fungiphilus]RKT60534.1 holo-[acyl-carrier protein] synthase [Azonexus fungiphilus]
MIVGIGTDIVAVARLRGMWERHGDKALDKLLAPDELDDFARAADKGRFLAKRFAAKEAFAKAFGTGVRPPVLLPAIAVGHDALGKPVFHFHGQLAEIVENRRLTVHLSISDEAEYAVAYVLLEQA